MTTSTEVDPAPVFVDQTGRRGRRLRGLGWVVGVLSLSFAVAMSSGLVGAQSEAPSLLVPTSADTTPPSKYIDAPPPVPPQGKKAEAHPQPKHSPVATSSTTRKGNGVAKTKATSKATSKNKGTSKGTSKPAAH